jgi:serine/threonine protein kinase
MAPKELVHGGDAAAAATSETLARQVERLLDNRYVVQRELGRGGTAIVFLATDRQLGASVAIKVLRPELVNALAAARFLREVEIVRHLDHPNILSLFDVGAGDGILFYTMPFFPGATLRERLRRETQLPLPDAIAITRQVAQALDHAHTRGVIHRDIKPANILLNANAVVVADFGIARAINIASGDTITSSNFAIGTPEYMSPEQASGVRDLDARSDIYSLGCVLYEMLAGSPPFSGPTAEAIIARHRHDVPHSVRVVRPSVPVSLESCVMKSLEKVRVDRYATASDFIAALDAVNLDGVREPVTRRLPSRIRIAIGATVVAALSVGGWLVGQREPQLDATRIVVFPPTTQGGSTVDGTSEAVATYIGYALGETRPLKWLEAWELSDDPERELARISGPRARRISMRARAGYYIDGNILRHADSSTVILKLHSVKGDSLLRVAGATSGADAYLPQLALRAVADLLPSILQPGATVDLRSLSERRTTAVANFLQGEHEYRRMQFAAALDHYRTAVAEDSALAIAAFKGAQTALWLSRPGIDTAFVQAALRHAQYLTAPQTLLVRGLQAYVTGAADSAVAFLRAAVRADSTLPGGWTLLGEVYARSLASEPAADSLAGDALRKARAMDRSFAPTLAMLEEVALRDGNLAEARGLRAELGHAGADTTHATERALMWQCLEKGPASVDWSNAARRDASSVLDAGRLFARAGGQLPCARAALRAVIESDSARASLRNGALLALNGVLLSGRRMTELRALMASARARDLRLWQLRLENAAAGHGFEVEAAAAHDSLGTGYAAMHPVTLWYLGGWAARRGAVAELTAIALAARHRADSSRARVDRSIAAALHARLTLATGDTARAIAQLRALKPSGVRREIAWLPWEGMAAERLLLAELLFRKRQYREAIQTAALLDATEPVPYLLYLRPSLELRLRAASAIEDDVAAASYRKKLDRLTR